MSGFDPQGLPSRPGVFVLYRNGSPVYIGRSVNLRATLAQAFARTGPSAVSPLRRSAAEFLGLAPARAIQNGRYRPTPDDHDSITRWVRSCSMAWRECASESDVTMLEAKLRAERQLAAPAGRDQPAA
jgi:hypothetical protein